MSRDKRIEVRLAVARGHWTLDEHEEALASLERAVAEAPDDPEVAALCQVFRRTLDARPEGDSLRMRAVALSTALSLRADLEPDPEREAGESAEDDAHPVATSTVAELLERQGHHDRALQVATDVLRRNPADTRALAVRERLQSVPRNAGKIAALERWLERIERIREGAPA